MERELAQGWIDVSVPLKNGMVYWPGDPQFNIEQIREVVSGGQSTLSKFSTSAHVGTHMDAPLHFIAGGRTIDQLPLSAVIGRARVIKISDNQSIKAQHLEQHRLQRGERVLFKTLNSEHCWSSDEFFKDFVYISKEAAEYLVVRGVQTVGVDYLSIGGFAKDGAETHQALLGAGIWAIEGLNLAAVEAGDYEMICLPLKLQGADGAPARAILRKLNE